MFKIKPLEINRYKFIIIISLVLTYVENIFALINKFQINHYEGVVFWRNIYYLTTESFLSLAIIMLLLLIFSFNKYLLKAISIVFLVISPVFIYYTVTYKIIIDEFVIGNAIEANPAEAPEFFSVWPYIILVVFGIIPSIILIKYITFKPLFNQYKELVASKFWRALGGNIFKLSLAPICGLLILVFIFNNSLLTNRNTAKFALSGYLPINYVVATEQYLVKVRKETKLQKNLTNIAQKYPFHFSNNLQNKPLIVVLVIGESARVQNQHYHGYSRNTNAYTEKLSNIVYFNDMQSCGTFTRWSVPCMLSYKSQADFKEPIDETNLITVFKELGFKTWWISGQSAYEKQYNTLFASAEESSEVYFMSALKPYVPSGSDVYDELLFRNINKAIDNNKYQDKLLVIQLYGSHIKYEKRYPQKFKKFTPSCMDTTCTEQAELNDYDNSLLYSDYILAELIKKLQNQNSILLYASDHGESLHVDHSGFLIHSAPYRIAPIEQKRVASLMWISDSMMKLLPKAKFNIQQYANLHISHDYIFHTLFGCLGIKSSIVNDNLNLCSSRGVSKLINKPK